jgi:hypothetical protein
MGISFDALPDCESGFEFANALASWSREYENRCMVPDMNNKKVADETTELLLYDVPKIGKPFGTLAVSALLTDRLRTAMMYPMPPATLKALIKNTLNLRKYILRWFALPRPWVLRRLKVMDEPDSDGRLFAMEYTAEPW